MSDATIFVLVFGGMFVFRIIAATACFLWILPAGDRCPNCDAHTLWIRKPFWNRVLPQLRSSWCPDCRWEGTLRHDRSAAITSTPGTRRARPDEARPRV